MQAWDPDVEEDGPRNRADGRGRSDVERLEELAETKYKVARRIPKRSVYIGVRSVLTLRELLDQLELETIRFARDNYWSWRMIGDALGISGSAVHKLYARSRVVRRKRRGS